MKKLLVLAVLMLLLSACSWSNETPSLTQVERLPGKVQESVDQFGTGDLVMLNEKNYSYVVFKSAGTVEHALETEGEKANTLLTVTDEDLNEPAVQHAYKLTMGDNHDTIDVLVNGQSTSFDMVIAGK